MSYKVTIEKIESLPTTQRDWKVIADTGNPKDGGRVYDYVTYPSTETKTTRLLEQQVEQLDVLAVIMAVNGAPTSSVTPPLRSYGEVPA